MTVQLVLGFHGHLLIINDNINKETDVASLVSIYTDTRLENWFLDRWRSQARLTSARNKINMQAPSTLMSNLDSGARKWEI